MCDILPGNLHSPPRQQNAAGWAPFSAIDSKDTARPWLAAHRTIEKKGVGEHIISLMTPFYGPFDTIFMGSDKGHTDHEFFCI